MTSEFSVREGTPSDLGAVVDIKVRSWAQTYGPILDPEALQPFLDHDRQLAELSEALHSPDTKLLVALDSRGEVAGFALAYLDAEPDPWLESLHVVDRVRGRGAGTLLMRTLAADLRSRGRDSLRLGVIEGNLGAARLYERLGATLVGVEPVSWARGVRHQLFRWSDLNRLI